MSASACLPDPKAAKGPSREIELRTRWDDSRQCSGGGRSDRLIGCEKDMISDSVGRSEGRRGLEREERRIPTDRDTKPSLNATGPGSIVPSIRHSVHGLVKETVLRLRDSVSKFPQSRAHLFDLLGRQTKSEKASRQYPL